MRKKSEDQLWSKGTMTRRMDQASGSGKAHVMAAPATPLERAMRKNMPHASTGEDYRHKGK